MRRRAAAFSWLKAGHSHFAAVALASPILLTLIIILVSQISSSLYFQKKDRINIVFYGEKTRYYSLGRLDGVHYYLSLFPDVKVKVPGGYGNYRVGGLGKLVKLEKNPDLIRRTFSVTTASTVDRYFYTGSSEIFYGKDGADMEDFTFPAFAEVFLTRTNANIFDKLFIYSAFLGKRKNQFSPIEYKSSIGVDEEFFQDKDFAKKYQGFLYNRIYRKEQKTVQIFYQDSYKTAFFLSKVIEGDGIRVSDLSQREIPTGRCEVIEEANAFSQSAKDLAVFFSCDLKKGKTESSDIIMKLGSLEKEWGIL